MTRLDLTRRDVTRRDVKRRDVKRGDETRRDETRRDVTTRSYGYGTPRFKISGEWTELIVSQPNHFLDFRSSLFDLRFSVFSFRSFLPACLPAHPICSRWFPDSIRNNRAACVCVACVHLGFSCCCVTLLVNFSTFSPHHLHPPYSFPPSPPPTQFPSANMSTTEVETLVIGAGPTGLGAAKRLNQLVS